MAASSRGKAASTKRATPLERKRACHKKKREELSENQRDYLLHWLENNRAGFATAMQSVQKKAPYLYAKYYIEMSKLVMPKEQNINVNIGLNRDLMELQALAGCGLEGTSAAPAIMNDDGGELPEFAEFEEIKDLDGILA